MICSEQNKKVLVIAGDTLSKVTDYEDRTTCILFGDGAGATLLEANDFESSFIATNMGSNGEGGKFLYRKKFKKII